MTLKIAELVSIVLSALVLGVFWGPWVALSRSMQTFTAEVFLAVVHRMDRNLAPVMTALMPVSLVSMVVVLFASHRSRPVTFGLTLAGLVLFVMTLLVTVLIEVPIVKDIRGWVVTTLPGNWEARRNRWQAFHLARVGGGLAGFALLVAGAIF